MRETGSKNNCFGNSGLGTGKRELSTVQSVVLVVLRKSGSGSDGFEIAKQWKILTMKSVVLIVLGSMGKGDGALDAECQSRLQW